jgi:hypothetical protein
MGASATGAPNGALPPGKQEGLGRRMSAWPHKLAQLLRHRPIIRK